jgi:hypothetical protein
VTQDRPRAGRALLEALRLLVGHPATLLHFLGYLAAGLAVGVLYLWLTAGRAYAGAAGAILLFVVRQAMLVSRFAVRVTVSAGQVAYVTERAAAGRS